MYNLDVKPKLDKKLAKLAKKNHLHLEIINKKIPEIRKNPHRFKNLTGNLKHLKRVHINTHFVLTFSVDEETKTVTLEDFDHHDNIYK
jgi:YafQ family addiction module toxin component